MGKWATQGKKQPVSGESAIAGYACDGSLDFNQELNQKNLWH
jgi:hypothetical protein